jgi:hypothetical protein
MAGKFPKRPSLLENGATVEEGIWKAEIVEQNWESPLGFTFPITRLIVT